MLEPMLDEVLEDADPAELDLLLARLIATIGQLRSDGTLPVITDATHGAGLLYIEGPHAMELQAGVAPLLVVS